MNTTSITLRSHFTGADKAAHDYAYVPFTLPSPAQRLHVRYRYSAAMSSDQIHGGNVIDIGLFDPRGTDFPGGAGFRGWSGSARSEFTISEDEATPGYLPGPLPAGEYNVILGLYRIWEAGADVEIEIEAELGTGDRGSGIGQNRSSAVRGRRSSFGQWLRGDLQSHTVHSDARGTLEQLIAKARALGLDFLAVTDHNTVSHHPFLPALSGDDLILIPGQEATTYYGHMNIWNTSRWCDFRCKTDADIAAVIELAHAHGGICSINHPKQGGPAWEYTTDLPVQAMEVWQGPWPHRNKESLALWDRLLCEGRRLPAVGGSDYHCPAAEDTNLLRLGQPTTWVKVAERSVPAVLDAIVAGRASISATPDGPRLALSATVNGKTAGMGEAIEKSDDGRMRVSIEILSGQGKTLRLVADGDIAHEEFIHEGAATATVDLPVQRYVRAELIGDMPADQLPPGAPADLDLRGWRWALSNPIWVYS
ncbi:MAG: CehA/McbA family metallohydrolase [Caldilineaceae bacterium]|nr:CehA/McbA family metallohydrolase [Caldilineaceae bacterium]